MMVKSTDMLKVFILIFFKPIDHQGQCLAHFIMGSSFVAYGIVMLLMLRVGGPLLIRNGKSQEWYDSWVILLWGIVNTFTEHRYVYIRKKFYVANSCKYVDGDKIGIMVITNILQWVLYGGQRVLRVLF